MCDHEHKCKECCPEAFPEVSPRTPGYRNAERHCQKELPQWVELNGERLKNVTEALSGKEGWAIICPPNEYGQVHPCKCGRDVCTDVKYGHVEFGPTLVEEYRCLLKAIKEEEEKGDCLIIIPENDGGGRS